MYCFLIYSLHKFFPRKGADKQEQSGAGQVKIGNKRINDLVAITRSNKQACMSLIWVYFPMIKTSHTLKHAYRSRADSDDTSTRLASRVNEFSSRSIHFNLFTMNFVVTHPLMFHGAKGI